MTESTLAGLKFKFAVRSSASTELLTEQPPAVDALFTTASGEVVVLEIKQLTEQLRMHSQYSTYTLSPEKQLDVSFLMQQLLKFIDPTTSSTIIQKFYENQYIVTLLADIIEFIQNFFTKLSNDKKVNNWEIGITLEEDIEEPEWIRIFVIIKGEFKFTDFKERLKIEDQIEKWIESTVNSYRGVEPMYKDKINEANALISIILESKL